MFLQIVVIGQAPHEAGVGFALVRVEVESAWVTPNNVLYKVWA